ncbi:hypothetical protein BDF22DRAFT_736104 [Syncephalis plumigaleata]|nr:hypothetical protein BDF22DRAFT_736104 [Syncephalis plumigaleata]
MLLSGRVLPLTVRRLSLPTTWRRNVSYVKSRSRVGATLLGFFMGATLTGALGWYGFLDDYMYASRTLLESVEDLESSTRKVRDYARKIEKVESTLRRLEEQAITQATFEDMRKELRTMMDASEESQYAWRGRIVELEKDVNMLLKKAQRI